MLFLLFMLISGLLLVTGGSISYTFYAETPNDWKGNKFYYKLTIAFAIVIGIWFVSLLGLLIHIW